MGEKKFAEISEAGPRLRAITGAIVSNSFGRKSRTLFARNCRAEAVTAREIYGMMAASYTPSREISRIGGLRDPYWYHIFLSWTQIAGCHGNLARPEYRYQRASTMPAE